MRRRSSAARIEALLDQSGIVAGREYVSKADARTRFRQQIPELASLTSDSTTIRFRHRSKSGCSADAEPMVAPTPWSVTCTTLPGVDDVRYDREFLAPLGAEVSGRSARSGWRWCSMMALAAAVTVASVVRLGLQARRDEIEIMELVGAPLTFIRGPFVAEGLLQGGIGALLALLALIGWVSRGPRPGGGGRWRRRSTGQPSNSCRFGSACCSLAGGMVVGQCRRICRLPSRRFHKCDLALTDASAAWLDLN